MSTTLVRQAPIHDRYQTLVWILFIPIVMFFVGLTSSLVIRKGASEDWIPLTIPGILYFNTIILLASSFTMEKVRRSVQSEIGDGYQIWLWLSTGLGLAFLVGQVIAWRQLIAAGAFLASSPSSSFFYVLTATHGAHLIGGIMALTYLTIRVLRRELTSARRSALRATVVYWHFMDALWIYLLFLLIIWR